MNKILLDTNFVADFAKSFPHKFENDNIYISLSSMIELTHKGFIKKRNILDKFIQRKNVYLLKHIWPFKNELINYPLYLNIDNFLFPKPNKIEELLESNLYKDNIKRFYHARIEFQNSIQEIKDYLSTVNVSFQEKNLYRNFIRKRIPSKIGKEKTRLRKVPFNCIIRLFPLEKFFIMNIPYKENDFNDLLICLISIYFDIFLTEEQNHNVLNKIKVCFEDIFQPDSKILCNKSKYKQNIKKGSLK